MLESNCPCGRGHYRECCQPLHQEKIKAQTAEQLMRSRYSAFARQEIEYLVKTTAIGQQSELDVAAMAEWSQSNQWLKLEILQSKEKLDKNHAQVEFKAHYHDGTNINVHHEVSHFVHYADAWYFLDPTLEMQITMKQPCICGSGKNFKQCCAQYL